MPTQKIHYYIAEKAMTLLGVEQKTDYLFGTSFPDVPEVAFRTKVDRSVRNKRHFLRPAMLNGMNYDIKDIPNVMVFLNTKKLNTDFHKGWFVHLVVDEVFNGAVNKKVNPSSVFKDRYFMWIQTKL